MAKVVPVIFTEDRRGLGTQDHPVRMVPQIWTLDGQLICEAEPLDREPPIVGPGLSALRYEPQ